MAAGGDAALTRAFGAFNDDDSETFRNLFHGKVAAIHKFNFLFSDIASVSPYQPRKRGLSGLQ